jgi:hypothetical protein
MDGYVWMEINVKSFLQNILFLIKLHGLFVSEFFFKILWKNDQQNLLEPIQLLRTFLHVLTYVEISSFCESLVKMARKAWYLRVYGLRSLSCLKIFPLRSGGWKCSLVQLWRKGVLVTVFFFAHLALSLSLSLEHRAVFSVSWSFLQTVGLLGRVISSSQGLYLNTGKHKQNNHIDTPNIHALGGIRIHDLGFRASEDSACLRPLGYRDRLWLQR